MTSNHIFMLKLLLSFLVRSRSRIFVAVIGIAIGATIFLSMLVLCYDIPRQMSREFRSYGANVVLLPAGQETYLSLEQAKQAVSIIPEDKIIGMTPYKYERMRSNMLPYTVAGTLFDEVRKTSPYWQITGQWPQKDTEILIGADIAETTQFTPGRTLSLEGRNKDQQRYDMNVVISGIVRTGGVEDGYIFIPLSAMNAMSGEGDKVDVIELSIAAHNNELNTYAAALRSHTPDIDPRLVKRVTRSEETVSGKLKTLIYLVTGIVLILTMICVATTMMTIIMERRREIGLKKAIGAENRNIAIEFLSEAVLLGLLGGLIGSVCGLFSAEFITSSVFSRSIEINFYLIPITILVSILVTILASLIPVQRAVEINPAVVLKGE